MKLAGIDLAWHGDKNPSAIAIGTLSGSNLIPQSEIDQLQIITGGIGARYGDVTGGIISITTKGPSQKFTGGFELETSEYLDSYGYNLASLNLPSFVKNNEFDFDEL